MQLNSITLRGIGPYKKKVSVNFDTLAGDLTAIVGENGAGKSVFLEAGFPGCIFRDTPTRGTLKSLATARDSLAENVITKGDRRYTLRHLIDAHSTKAEALVMDESGTPLNVSGKLPEYDAWAARNLLPPDVFYATIFTPQAFTGFLGMKRAERKALLVQQLGLEKYERYAEIAKQHAKAARQSLADVEARINELNSGDKMTSTEAEQVLRIKNTEVAELTSALETGRANLEVAEQKLRDLQAESRDRERWQAELKQAETDLNDVNEKIHNNEAVLANKAHILAAVARAEELPGLIDTAQSESRQLLIRQQTCMARIAQLRQAVGAASRSKTALESRIVAIEARMKRKAEIDEAKPQVKTAQEKVDRLTHELKKAEAEVQRLNGLSLSSAEERATRLRDGHDRIIELNQARQYLIEISKSCASNDDAALSLAQTLPAEKKAANDTLVEIRFNLREAEAELRRIQDLLLLEADLAVAEEELQSGHREQTALEASLKRDRARLETAESDKIKIVADLKAADDLLEKLAEEQRDIAQETKLAAPLSNADARLVELRGMQTRLSTQIADLKTKLDKPFDELPDLSVERAAVTNGEDTLRRAIAAVAVLEQSLKNALERESRLESLSIEAEQHRVELADSTLLQESYGKDGLQALKIDAAGPELSDAINDLLRSCIGPRWTVSIETTRMTADNRKQLEGCDVIVADNEVNRIASGESLSGGQKVIIGEAISLALTKLACRRHGIVGATLVRDESGAALSAQYAPLWIKMLRRAKDLLKAARVLYVSHNIECQELADSWIVIKDGTVSVR